MDLQNVYDDDNFDEKSLNNFKIISCDGDTHYAKGET